MIGILALVRLAVLAALSPGHATLAVVDPPFRFGGHRELDPETRPREVLGGNRKACCPPKLPFRKPGYEHDLSSNDQRDTRTQMGPDRMGMLPSCPQDKRLRTTVMGSGRGNNGAGSKRLSALIASVLRESHWTPAPERLFCPMVRYQTTSLLMATIDATCACLPPSLQSKLRRLDPRCRLRSY